MIKTEKVGMKCGREMGGAGYACRKGRAINDSTFIGFGVSLSCIAAVSQIQTKHDHRF